MTSLRSMVPNFGVGDDIERSLLLNLLLPLRPLAGPAVVRTLGAAHALL